MARDGNIVGQYLNGAYPYEKAGSFYRWMGNGSLRQVYVRKDETYYVRVRCGYLSIIMSNGLNIALCTLCKGGLSRIMGKFVISDNLSNEMLRYYVAYTNSGIRQIAYNQLKR